MEKRFFSRQLHSAYKRKISLGLAVALGLVAVGTSLLVSDSVAEEAYAATISQLETEKKQAQQEANSLKKEKKSLDSNYKSTLGKYNKLMSSISSTKAEIASSEKEMSKLATELADAQAKEAEIKEGMKLRAKYMYERGDYVMLDKLFSCQTMGEFINQAQYISNLLKYDSDQIDELEKLQITIQERSKQLSGRQIELQQAEKNLSASQGELRSLVASSKGELDDKAAEVAAATGKVNNLEAQIAEMKKREAAIEAANAASHVAQSESIVGDQDTSGALVGYTQEDLRLLAAIIQAEADNQGDVGRLAVGSVVMNRVKHRQFPNTIYGVVYQSGQFAPASSGRLQLILNQGPNAGCMSAAKRCLEGYRSFDYLFFCTVSYRNKWEASNGRALGDRCQIVGAHYFYIYNRNM